MPTNAARAAVYLRISLDQTGDERAIERQRADAMALVKKSKWTLHDEYIDNSISASRREKKRPAYDRMESDFLAGRFSVIVCYDLDRLTRQPAQLEKWIEYAETRGLRIVTTNGEADLGTDGGRMYARIKAAVAKGEVERMGARRKRANEQTVASGKPAPGRRPFGWDLGGIKIRPDEAKVVRVAYLYLLHGGSLHKLSRYWNGALTRTKKDGVSETLKREPVTSPQGTPWTPFKIRQLIDRKRNMGVLERYGVAQPGSLIEPLVDVATFEAVQAIISKRAQPGRKPERHLLSGLAVCGTCDKALGSKSLRDGSGVRSPYYVCSSRINRNSASDGKTHPTIREGILESAVEDAVAAAFLMGPKSLFPKDKSEDWGALHRARQEAQEGVQRLIGMVARGLASEGEASAQLAVLRREEEVAEAAIRAAQARSSSVSFADIRGDVMTGQRVSLTDAGDAHAALVENFRALQFEQRRRLVRALLEIVVNTGYGAKRVRIRHKIVTSLNEDDDAAYDRFSVHVRSSTGSGAGYE
jgi:site-specific DNA recombinase